MFQARAGNWPMKEQNVNYKTNPFDCIQPRCDGLNSMRQCLPRSLDNLNIWSRARNWPVKEQDVKLQNEPNQSKPITLQSAQHCEAVVSSAISRQLNISN